MKKIIFKIIVAIAIISTVQSCTFLDIVPDNTATIDDAFTRPAEAKNFLYSLYSFMPKVNDHLTSPQLWGTDEVAIPWTWYEAYKLITQPISTGYPFFDFWGNPGGDSQSYYEGIRQAYTFLDNIDKTPGFSEDELNSMKGEATFIIGYLHFCIIRQYGPAIVVKHTIPLDAPKEEYYPYRTSYDESIAFCVDKFDEAYTLLPYGQSKSDYGRISKPIVSAIKGRMLLYAASPLFNGNTDFAGISGGDGKDLFSQSYDNEKWMKAIKSIEEAIDDADFIGATLYKGHGSDAVANTRYSMVEPWNNELIWGHRQEYYWGWQRHAAPRVIDGGVVTSAGGIAPTMRQVELYYTKNGLPIDQDPNFDYSGRLDIASGDETAQLHRNREPRFYSNIGFDRGDYLINDSAKKLFLRYNESDGYDGVDRSNYSRSGYLVQKGVHPQTMFTSSDNIFIEYPWPKMRLAELYLNMAEALNEYGFGTTDKFGHDAKYYLNLIRERAGIPFIDDAWSNSYDPGRPNNQTGLREIIQTERRIELAFEGHRIWDVRRWKKGEELNTPVYGLDVNKTNGSEFYSKVKIEERYFDVSRSYLWPISLRELQYNPNLVQNPGY